MKSLLFTLYAVLFCTTLLSAEPDKTNAPHSTPGRVEPGQSGQTINGVYHPPIAPASNEAANSISRIKIPEGMKLNLWAAEPMVANPVAFGFDNTGRMFICETFRQKENRGVEDNRKHGEWLNDDLAATSIEDRLAYIKKHRPDQGKSYTVEHDRLRLLTDTDGDGVADKESVYADGFNDILDGTGAGVLSHNGEVFYTCIPNLWRLRDKNNDGKADEREKLSTGYGVKFAFRGHDMHGLVIGPDGRLYFSIGDRGLNVTTKEGRHLYNPDSGAVLRCELDGSNLEIFCTGLRNPQELAFDDYGNLFTVDNNSDSGDKARLYHLVQGGDYGWRMHYQYLPDRGPWNREKLWHLAHEGQAAYVIPPIAHITDGPSGLVAYPGTGLGDEYAGAFFVCDFRGGPANSAIRMFKMEPDGATFKLTKYEPFVENVLATDCDFGPDGAFYISDWVDGWDGLGKGRIYRLTNDKLKTDPLVAEVKKLLAEGFDQREVKELCKLLEHRDRRVRMGAQFALVKKKAINELLEILRSQSDARLLAHVHGAIRMIIVNQESDHHHLAMKDIRSDQDKADMKLIKEELASIQVKLVDCLKAEQSLERANPIWVLILDVISVDEYKQLIKSSPNWPCLAQLLQTKEPLELLHGLSFISLVNTDDKLKILSNIVNDGLLLNTAIASDSLIRFLMSFEVKEQCEFYKHPDPRIRMLIMRAQFFADFDDVQCFVDETAPANRIALARHWHSEGDDLLAPYESLNKLALWITKPFTGTSDQYDALFRRVLNANYMLGGEEQAVALAKYAARNDVPESLRIEAIDMLEDWAKPSPIDRVTGQWRKELVGNSRRSTNDFNKMALQAEIATILSGPAKVREKAVKTAGKLGIKEISPLLLKLYSDAKSPVATQVAALEALAVVDQKDALSIAEKALSHEQPLLRIAARNVLLKAQPQEAVALLNTVFASGTISEQQAAVQQIAQLKRVELDEVLVPLAQRLIKNELPAELRLDVLEATRQRTDKAKNPKRLESLTQLRSDYDALPYPDAPLSKWRESMVGGDAERGSKIFYEKIAVSCVRCHKIDDRGGEVGPNLSAIGKDKTRQYLLEAIVDPNRAVAQGFETVVITTNAGQTLSGIIKRETKEELTLLDANAKETTIKLDDIDERQKGLSSMPADLTKELTPFEVRDLVEFLSSRKGK